MDDSISNIAQTWAENLLRMGKMSHSGNKLGEDWLGENLFWSSKLFPNAAIVVVQSWYDEINKYDFQSFIYQCGTGHFSQVVWKATTTIGVGIVVGSNGKCYIVAYSPAGNWMGQFKENVLPPQE